MEIFRLFFLVFTLKDLVDVLLVSLMFYYLYRVGRGGLAVPIAVGLLSIYVVWLVVDVLGFTLMSRLLGRFAEVGVVVAVILFQPEIRRFLLFLGRSTPFFRINNSWQNGGNALDGSGGDSQLRALQEIQQAVYFLASEKTGVLIVIAKAEPLDQIITTGIPLGARLSATLLRSIFQKSSPMHDGAVVVSEGRVEAASCVLPITEAETLPQDYGMRHRAAVGMTENSDAVVVIVSEERGDIGIAYSGHIRRNFTEVTFVSTLLATLQR